MKKVPPHSPVPVGKWQRREQKKRPKMAVHGRGMKKLAAALKEGGNKKRRPQQ
jgi:hypothetical protein